MFSINTSVYYAVYDKAIVSCKINHFETGFNLLFPSQLQEMSSDCGISVDPSNIAELDFVNGCAWARLHGCLGFSQKAC